MRNAIELARVTKEIYRATNELLQIVVTIKTRSKKMKEYDTIKKDILGYKKALEKAKERVIQSVDTFIQWALN